ncbi:TraR/DksA C4-type zinc finger protein [soil metagenome]
MVAPAPLTGDQQRARRDALLAERSRVARQLAGLERTFDELVAAADREPPDDEHDPDGTTAYERAQVTSLAAEARAHLDDLDRAHAAIERGDDAGVCQRCGEPIVTERLLALPATRRCVGCAATR